MAVLPAVIVEALKKRNGPAVFATTDGTAKPNIVYVGGMNQFGDDRLVVADNFFDKTRANVKTGPGTGCLLFMTTDNKAYQIKGRLEYHTKGEIFESMKKWNPASLPGHAVVALVAEEAYSGATRIE